MVNAEAGHGRHYASGDFHGKPVAALVPMHDANASFGEYNTIVAPAVVHDTSVTVYVGFINKVLVAHERRQDSRGSLASFNTRKIPFAFGGCPPRLPHNTSCVQSFTTRDSEFITAS